MNWFQRIAVDFTNEDRIWSYEDHKAYNKINPDDYMSIGHDSSNVILFNIMDDFRLREIGPEELQKEEYKNRNHNLINRNLDSELVNGRIELDTNQGSISIFGMARKTNSFKAKVLNIVFNHYPGVNFFVWESGLQKIPLQQYWEMLGE